ncbi:unnamed protein product [Arabidopsis thaliana]|uniref:(thale cress) hypothetical protein n=1 Tax=Arabidopsis thaliana TaxID=3702 RepID=A0A7G2DVD4_ARATH|nr:unnamed protein product [Arabidopsis thaliana]
MDLDPNQTNNVSSERSKLKAKEPVILKIHKHHFKEMVHRLTGSTCGRRFDMLRPPPFVVNNSPPSASRITTQRPYRFPTVPTMTDPMITSTVESLNTRPPSPPSLPREKDSVEARVMEDDMNQEQLHGSMLPPLFGIPPPVQVTSPDESLYWQLPESLNGPLSPSLMLSPVQQHSTTSSGDFSVRESRVAFSPINIPYLIFLSSPTFMPGSFQT